jgi:hypothetical protein
MNLFFRVVIMPISQGCFQLVQFGGKKTILTLSRSKASKCPGALSNNKRTQHPVHFFIFGKNTSLNHFSHVSTSIHLVQLRYDLALLGLIEAFPVRFLWHCSRIKRLGSDSSKVRTYQLSTHNPPRFKLRT